jgi:uncharacterized protein (TIGR03435 family)
MKLFWAIAFIALQAMGQDAVFEVATIKPSRGTREGLTIHNNLGGTQTTNTTLHDLIQYALGAREFQVVGGPPWIKEVRFDVNATNERAEEPFAGASDVKGNAARLARIRARLLHLLEDRFQLQLREEQREVPVYALSVDKSGPKMTVAEAPLGNADFNRTLSGGTMKIKGSTMARLCQLLGGMVERPVNDETGLTGAFDLELKYSLDTSSPEAEPSSKDATSTYPSIFTAVRERLGLRLTEKKGLATTWVVIRAEKASEN